jgi:hypothetical protein
MTIRKFPDGGMDVSPVPTTSPAAITTIKNMIFMIQMTSWNLMPKDGHKE